MPYKDPEKRRRYQQEYAANNRESLNTYQRGYCAGNKSSRENSRLKYRYGITLDEKATMLASQDFKCATCLTQIDISTSNVDHCHATERVRGLLCASCNKALGLFKDDKAALARAITYLGD